MLISSATDRPCKDIIMEANVGRVCEQSFEMIAGQQAPCISIRNPNDPAFQNCASKIELSPGVELRAYGAMSSPDQRTYLYQQTQAASSASSQPITFPKLINRRREASSSHYHPYRKGNNLNLAFPSDDSSLKSTKTSGPTDSVNEDSGSPTMRNGTFPPDSSSHSRQHHVFHEDEVIATPLTPLTQYSEDISALKEDSPLFERGKFFHYQSLGDAGCSRESSDVAKAARRRRAHLQSEQRRREHIKDGMDRLVQLVPACQESRDTKGISKAAILRHAYEYIYQLRSDLQTLKQLNNCKDRELSDFRKRLGLPGSSSQNWRPLR